MLLLQQSLVSQRQLRGRVRFTNGMEASLLWLLVLLLLVLLLVLVLLHYLHWHRNLRLTREFPDCVARRGVLFVISCLKRFRDVAVAI